MAAPTYPDILALPDTLEAFVAIAEEENAPEDKADAPDKEAGPDDSERKEEGTVSGAGTDTEIGAEGTDVSAATPDRADAPESSTDAALQDSQTEQPEQAEQVTIENITWESVPAYDAETEGAYVFTPSCPKSGCG